MQTTKKMERGKHDGAYLSLAEVYACVRDEQEKEGGDEQNVRGNRR